MPACDGLSYCAIFELTRSYRSLFVRRTDSQFKLFLSIFELHGFHSSFDQTNNRSWLFLPCTYYVPCSFCYLIILSFDRMLSLSLSRNVEWFFFLFNFCCCCCCFFSHLNEMRTSNNLVRSHISNRTEKKNTELLHKQQNSLFDIYIRLFFLKFKVDVLYCCFNCVLLEFLFSLSRSPSYFLLWSCGLAFIVLRNSHSSTHLPFLFVYLLTHSKMLSDSPNDHRRFAFVY